MVLSVREANRQSEEQRRLKRLDAARKHGMNLGVSAARNYRLAKADQAKAVAADLHREWAKGAAAVAAHRTDLVSYARDERGEAHRTASRVMAERTERALAERDAWEAELAAGRSAQARSDVGGALPAPPRARRGGRAAAAAVGAAAGGRRVAPHGQASRPGARGRRGRRRGRDLRAAARRR